MRTVEQEQVVSAALGLPPSVQDALGEKRWQSGDMCLRWTAAGMLEAETQFRKIVG